MTILLQTCATCGAVQYPRRSVCRVCLSDALADVAQPAEGTLRARVRIEASLDPYWSARLPVEAGTVELDAGVHAIVLLDGAIEPGGRVELHWDQADTALLVASSTGRV